MSLFYLLGMIGTMAYGTYLVKNEVQAITTDTKMKVTNNSSQNIDQIYNNFVSICKRSRIKLENGLPIYSNQCERGMAYLRYQGYTNDEIDYFKRLFESKHQAYVNKKENDIQQRIDDVRQIVYRSHTPKVYVYRYVAYNCYSLDKLEERMNKIHEHPVWSHITESYSYVVNADGKYEEVWKLNIPKYERINISQLYHDICTTQNIKNKF